MRVDVVTIFPEYFTPLELSLIGRARTAGLVDLQLHDLRQWTYDLHRTVDDTPYGGGPGMVMRPEPWGEALDSLLGPAGSPVGAAAVAGRSGDDPAAVDSAPTDSAAATHDRAALSRLIVPSPAGVPFSHALAAELATEPRLLFACGRYEGIDQRVLDYAAQRTRLTEVSLGDYVLFGGEVAAMVILEAVLRLVPGVLGNAASLAEESHTDGLLEAPVFTKPAVWRDAAVPDVLRSGDHGRIARWRRDESLSRTAQRRPDLLAQLSGTTLDKRDIATLTEAGFQVPGANVAK